MSDFQLSRRRLTALLLSSIGAGAVLCLPGLSLANSRGMNRRLILIELAGANDGLNTIVPYSHDMYRKLRPTVGLSSTELLAIDDELAFHKALEPLMPVWQSGELAVVNGVGYPSPNRSHFASIKIWETGGDGDEARRQGWLTHDVEHRFSDHLVDAHGISFDGRSGLFLSKQGNWLSMSTAEQFNSASVMGAEQSKSDNPALMSVLHSQQALKRSVEAIAQKVQSAGVISKIRERNLGSQLNHVVDLISAGVEVPVFKVSLSGFDTHENQKRRHQRLLRSLAAAMAELRRELVKIDAWASTTILTYSEFGRRAQENRSGGTDHGAASMQFVMGGAVRGGFYGSYPDLSMLEEDDLNFTQDYRSVYEKLLRSCFDVEHNQFSAYRSDTLDNLI